MKLDSVTDSIIETIEDRSLPQGGFEMTEKSTFLVEATAWAVLALDTCRGKRNLAVSACRRLAEIQLSNGQIAAYEGYPAAYWPTSLAIFAWETVSGFESELNRAARFLLTKSGKHTLSQETGELAHDTSIKGWPWVENTHSWVQPTVLAILALRVCGYTRHERVLEAVRMILDRQLPTGGWNYGNTVVFGKQLMPSPECTGHALCALAGYVKKKDVKLSLDYLNHEITRIRSPLALSWSIFGLTAWHNRPSLSSNWIIESLALQKKYSNYDTALLAQLIIAYCAIDGFLSLFPDRCSNE